MFFLMAGYFIFCKYKCFFFLFYKILQKDRIKSKKIVFYSNFSVKPNKCLCRVFDNNICLSCLIIFYVLKSALSYINIINVEQIKDEFTYCIDQWLSQMIM